MKVHPHAGKLLQSAVTLDSSAIVRRQALDVLTSVLLDVPDGEETSISQLQCWTPVVLSKLRDVDACVRKKTFNCLLCQLKDANYGGSLRCDLRLELFPDKCGDIATPLQKSLADGLEMALSPCPPGKPEKKMEREIRGLAVKVLQNVLDGPTHPAHVLALLALPIELTVDSIREVVLDIPIRDEFELIDDDTFMDADVP
jgi:hypothetical protein